MKPSKRYLQARKLIDRSRFYPLREAVELIQRLPKADFDETLDIAVRLGVNPRRPEQTVRGTVDLPYGTGKSVRVIAFAQGEKVREALDAGAAAAGGNDLVQRIAGGWLEFDATVATPDMMPAVSKTLGRILGPRGLMPNPRTGTISMEVGALVRAIRGGRIDYRGDQRTGGIVHAPIGKVSFSAEQLQENIQSFVQAIVRAKPATAKGRYLQSITLSPSMGPGVRLDTSQFS